MKKFLIIFGILVSGMTAQAEFVESASGVTMDNFWERQGKEEEKVLGVGAKIININHLDKRIPMLVRRDKKTINAFSYRYDKTVVVTTGIMLYIDNDDELAYLIGHEIAHSLDSYGGIGKWAAMTFNSKQYEYKADLIGIDLMVKAGYNPVAAITLQNKFFPEPPIDLGILTSHPKSSKRMFEAYKYIYKKYPWALNTDMVKNVNYVNFTYSADKDITSFEQAEKERVNRTGRPSL